MKKIKHIFIYSFIFITTTFFYGCESAEGNSTKKTGYSLKPNEISILDRLLLDEQTAFIEGRDSFIFGDKMQFISAIDVAEQYEANQVAADQQFFKKKRQISGVVESINSGFGNEPYISLRGVNQFLSPQFRFIRSTEKIASLQKGQTVSLLCEGAGVIVGTPIFQGCIFAEDYASNKADEAKKKVIAFLSGQPANSDVIPKLAIASIAMARSLPQTSTCFTDGSKCNEELEIFFNNDTAISQMAAVSEELRKNGVFVPEEPSK